MACVCHHTEHVLQYVRVVGLIEGLGCLRLPTHVLKQLEKYVETGVRYISHCVYKCPDDGVQDQFELCRRYIEE